MALTRKFLTAMGIEADKVDEIISAHIEVVNGLKKERDDYKENAEKLPTVEKELSDLKKKIEKNGDNPFETKYNELKQEFDNYKNNVETEKLNAKKLSSATKMLKDIKVSDSVVEQLAKMIIDDIEFDDDGKAKKADELKENYKERFADFLVKSETRGAGTENPPAGTEPVDTEKMSDEDYYKTIFKKGN